MENGEELQKEIALQRHTLHRRDCAQGPFQKREAFVFVVEGKEVEG